MARILHVEDDEAWIDLVRDALPDHQVDPARTLAEALRLLVRASQPYDLALVDLHLGDADTEGGEVLDALRSLHPTTLRVLVTGEPPGGAFIKNVVLRYGLEEVLIKKTFHLPDLRKVIDKVRQDVEGSTWAPSLPPAVFISYEHGSDGGYVRELEEHLTNASIPVWFDEVPASGSQWTTVVKARIDACVAFIVVMTPRAEASHWVSREVSRAEEVGKTIVPLLLEGRVFPTLGNRDCEDVVGGRLPGAHFVARLLHILGRK